MQPSSVPIDSGADMCGHRSATATRPSDVAASNSGAAIGGAISGTVTIGGVGTFNVTGTATNKRLRLSFASGGKTQDFTASGSASGLGDVLVRGKFNLVGTPKAGAGIGADLRVPSGDEKNMLGTGATQLRIFFIGAL